MSKESGDVSGVGNFLFHTNIECGVDHVCAYGLKIFIRGNTCVRKKMPDYSLTGWKLLLL